MTGYENYGHQHQNGHNDGSVYGSTHGQQTSNGGEAHTYYGQGHLQGYPQQSFGEPRYDQEPPQYQQYPSAAPHSSNPGHFSQNQDSQSPHSSEGNPEADRGLMGGLAGGAAGAFGGHALGSKAGHGGVGTVVGALAGAFAGHKAQDAASDRKEERHEKKEWEKQQQQQQQQQQQNSHQAAPPQGFDHDQNSSRSRGDFGGNFTASSRDIRLDAHGDYHLHAQCRRLDGSWQPSSISLNQILENDAGSFRWSQGASSGPNTYTVQQGDTFRAIAGRFSHCSYEDLARHNSVQNADLIHPGQTLQIPCGGGRNGGDLRASARNLRLVDGGQRLEGELERNGQWYSRSVILDERINNRDGCLEFI